MEEIKDTTRHMDYLKSTLKPAWKVAPTGDLTPFVKHLSRRPFWGKTNRPGLWKYDKHASYLAAMASVRVGVGDYEHRTEHRAGCLLVQPGLYKVVSYRLPAEPALRLYLDLKVGDWRYLQDIQLLCMLGADVNVDESYQWPQSARVFYPFYEALRDRREAGENVKDIYTTCSGMLAHLPLQRHWKGMLYRPDWHRMIVAEANKVLLWQVYQAWQQENIWPVGIKIDAAYYDRPVNTYRLGDGVGQYSEEITSETVHNHSSEV